jgi:TolA-binding protein
MTEIITLLASLQLGSFFLQCYQMYLDSLKTTNKQKITELEESLKKALKRIDQLEEDNARLHNEVNIVKEENSILLGLLQSQENKEEMIQKLIDRKSS